MEKIHICYSNVSNAGDAINPIIVRNIMGYKPILSNQFDCQISGIGSGLRRFFVNLDNKGDSETIAYEKYGLSCRERKIILWSAGFICTPTGNEIPISTNMKVASVRGKKSKEYVERILSQKLDCTVGDGGLLVSELIKKPIAPKYRLGIIPHKREKGEETYNQILREIDNSIILDIEQPDVMNLLKEISQCEVIISSSLHGLIFSDSFCIPNKHVVLTNRLVGDGFKFTDYYSTWDAADNSIDLRENHKIDVEKIKSEYRLTQSDIDEKKKEIIDAFKRYL